MLEKIKRHFRKKPTLYLRLRIFDRAGIREMIDCFEEIRELHPDIRFQVEFEEEPRY